MKNLALTLIIGLSFASCNGSPLLEEKYPVNPPVVFNNLKNIEKIVFHAELQTSLYCTYDGSYRGMSYPGGDIERSTGVCTDVVIRSLRAADVDLQQLIHEDMKSNLELYSRRYYTKAVDKNIDHRRTQNIQTYLTRKHAKLNVKNMSPEDYKPGDVIFWDIAAGHTGIVVESMNNSNTAHLIVHNIGGGPQYEDLLSTWTPVDAYRLGPGMIAKMQADCSYKHDFKSDPYYINYYEQ